MRRHLLSACVAALSLAACNDPQPSPRAAKPVIPSASLAVARPDAGMVISEPTVVTEVLGLAHAEGSPVNHLRRADDYALEGDLPSALIEARREVFDHPTDDEALVALARYAKARGEKEIAAVALGKLAALRPDDAAPLTEQGRLWIRLGAYDSAIVAANTALARDPQSAEAHHVLGRAYLSMNDLERAIPELEEAVDLDPDHGYALNNLGFAYLRANENQKAVEVLEIATELLPQVAYVVNNLGVALERVGRVEEAKHAYWRATDLSPKYVKAKINAARVARVDFDPTEAEAESPLATPED